ncbi:guanylate kinase [Notoacmeibacter sp. MSK16QG-6]|uniref:guanylate kinase n=1 Tax=Notoacmeibacter sp. MSK16QG-6 TaxID=2957982 RepID=UPI00209D2780|nr:guanylate kinase [Notoacmeibacter sp. MSK16QG-6]MCP1197982.1 guanylate kinase [Notoacmeibacter sp. MSK16QG-6]
MIDSIARYAAAAERRSIPRRGLMLVLSSPSGAGKSTISRSLLETDPAFRLSVSVTTRKRRSSEIDGQHYHFRSVADFEVMRERDELLEWAEVHGNFYGTPRAPAEQAIGDGQDMLFDIDWQGAQQMKDKVGIDMVSIFILPPSLGALRERLKRRAEDSEDVIGTRLRNAREEIAHWREYDYIVINDDLNDAFHEVQAIVTAERLRRDRRPGLFDFVSEMLKEEI